MRRVARLIAVAGALLAGCEIESGSRFDGSPSAPDRPPERSADPGLAPDPEPVLAPSPRSDAPSPASSGTPPALDHEPTIGVLLARAPRVTIQIDSECQLEAAGLATRVGPGAFVFELAGSGWRIAGDERGADSPAVLASGGRPIFALDATPIFGERRRLVLAGDLVIQPTPGALEVVERVSMEDYVARVVASEMNPKWPANALAAQAIVARSYAAARWMERAEEPWQLHWHFGVDMAYHGWSASAEAVARAIAATRGEVLVYGGFPVLALFHASSGGRTEAFERIKPGVLAPDGKTPIAAAMPVVADEAAEPGAAGLALGATHGRWKADLALPELTESLWSWSRAAPGRPVFGTVEAVSVLERHADSGRVARVSIRHRLDGAERFTSLAATDFRLAAGPVRVRSLLWDRCVIASKAPGYLVLEGRGYGHGCGLSQVSAWYLATQGASAEAIVARFYSCAQIERRY